jgi:hypothetical protein
MKIHEDLSLLHWITTTWPILWLVSWLLSIGAGVIKERAFSGFLWGLLFGPVGLLIVLLLLPDLKKARLKKEAEAAMLAWQNSNHRPGVGAVYDSLRASPRRPVKE